MTEDNEEDFKPPYVSFTMLLNVLERMRTEGIPARVDRSYLGSTSGTTKAQFLAAAKGLGLLDNDLKPTGVLQGLVSTPEQRPRIMQELLTRFYPKVVALGTNATQQQLEETFREEYDISGSTVRKAISFYLAAARFAKVELSPHFTAPRVGGATPGKRRPRSKTAAAPPPPAPVQVDPMAELRTKYVETLLDKFAAANGEVDKDVADRIERLVGFQSTATGEGE
ncbi:MAG TPA: DUF5343 domain-containing protein [Solirubrobacteraceae bacterium]